MEGRGALDSKDRCIVEVMWHLHILCIPHMYT